MLHAKFILAFECIWILQFVEKTLHMADLASLGHIECDQLKLNIKVFFN